MTESVKAALAHTSTARGERGEHSVTGPTNVHRNTPTNNTVPGGAEPGAVPTAQVIAQQQPAAAPAAAPTPAKVAMVAPQFHGASAIIPGVRKVKGGRPAGDVLLDQLQEQQAVTPDARHREFQNVHAADGYLG
jgi:hypothetical protein